LRNLVSLLGIFVFIFIAWLFSEDRKRFPWRVVTWGLALQLIFGFLVLWWEPGARFFLKLNDVFNALLSFSKEGAVFVFNSVGSADSTGTMPLTLKEYLTRLGAESHDPLIQMAIKTGTVPGFFFAFQVLTTIIFFSALLSVLYYLGIMQKVVLLFAKIMAHTMRVSGAESLSNSANIFVGQTEAPLVVRPYIEKMTRSELMAIMVGGFANTAGGVLGAYVMMLSGYFPNIAAHLISASLLSAPAAFIFAKILVPEREEPLTSGELKMDVPIEDANVLDAASNGTTVGWQLAINVAAMLVSFVALIALVNLGVSRLGGFFHDMGGFLQFNLAVVAAILALLWCEFRRPPSETTAWTALGIVFVLYLATRFVAPPAAGTVGLVGFAAWLPLFLQSGKESTYGRKGWLTVAGIAVAADIAYLAWGPLAPGTPLSLQGLLGWLHWPVAYVMGVPAADCLTVGRFLGEKLILTEFVAYLDLSNYLGAAARGEVPALDPRSIVILTYALCGFSNFASIGIQIGGIAPLAPSRRHELARLGLKAMVGGALATFMIACIAGIFYTGRSMLGGS
jgi:CNT family concentrative nucleoside transporter